MGDLLVRSKVGREAAEPTWQGVCVRCLDCHHHRSRQHPCCYYARLALPAQPLNVDAVASRCHSPCLKY